MCQWCLKHSGEGKKWFHTASNYARRLYKIRKEKAGQLDAEASPQSVMPMAGMINREVIELSEKDPEKFNTVRKQIEQTLQATHFGQVLTLKEVLIALDISYPIVRMSCVCRRASRGLPDRENMFCVGLGIGMYKWERWPETYRGGVHFMTPSEAKEWITDIDEKGMVHVLFTFGTPYIGGLCNCDYPACVAIKARRDYGFNILIKGHSVAIVNYSVCTGCGKCVERCQFGAINIESSLHKARVAPFKCFGCALCATGCPNGSITMVSRESLPALRNEW